MMNLILMIRMMDVFEDWFGTLWILTFGGCEGMSISNLNLRGPLGNQGFHAMCFLFGEAVDFRWLTSQFENLLNHVKLILSPKDNQMPVLFWELTSGSYSGMETFQWGSKNK